LRKKIKKEKVDNLLTSSKVKESLKLVNNGGLCRTVQALAAARNGGFDFRNPPKYMYKDKEKQKEYGRNWNKNRRHKFLSGKLCCICGSSDKIEIHHLDKSKKKTHRIWTYKEETILRELDKCIIICKKCHQKIHSDERRKNVKHGSSTMYDSYKCRCILCRKHHSEKMKNYRIKIKFR
jgi:hypothetical protein